MFVVLATEPVGGRSRVTDLPFINIINIFTLHDFTHSLYIHCKICQSWDSDCWVNDLFCYPGLVWLLCHGLILLLRTYSAPGTPKMKKKSVRLRSIYIPAPMAERSNA